MTLTHQDQTGTVVWIRYQGPADRQGQVPCLVITSYWDGRQGSSFVSTLHSYGFDRQKG